MKYLTFLLFLIAFALQTTTHAADNVNFTGTIKRVGIKEAQVTDTLVYSVMLDDGKMETVDAYGDARVQFEVGDRVTLFQTVTSEGDYYYYVTDHLRTPSIGYLFLIFIAVVVVISRKAGVMSLIGMAYTFFIIFKFLLPLLFAGNGPIPITMLGVMLIAPVSFVLSHGLNSKTRNALIATLLSLGITSVLALIFINVASLSGFGSEEAYFLQVSQGALNIKGIFLAGIIIGTLGILDDATVTQASIVAQLKESNKNLSGFELFNKAMAVGHDHIASTVNTLILVYTGASLPLLLLFIQSEESFLSVLNSQIIAEEVVTMLVSSIGLIISIPIATLLAVHLASKPSNKGFYHQH